MTVFIVFVLKFLPTVQCRLDSKVEGLLVSSSDFLNPPANLILGIFSLDLVYAGDKPGGMWLSPISHLGTGGFLYPCAWPSVSTPLLLQ